jgi:hypothetical protein
MGKRGPNAHLTEEDRKKHRYDAVKRSRDRLKRVEFDLQPGALEHLKEIKVRWLGLLWKRFFLTIWSIQERLSALRSKPKDRVTWNECLLFLCGFAQTHFDAFSSFISQPDMCLPPPRAEEAVSTQLGPEVSEVIAAPASPQLQSMSLLTDAPAWDHGQ